MRFAIPIVLLLGLLALLGAGLRLDPREVPSPLVGKPAPAFSLTRLDDGATVDQQALQGRPLLVNFFASWCPGCQVEHPVLMRLAQDAGVEIVGIDYKDTPEAVQTWLSRRGNPYRSILQDAQGRMGLDWGVYGVPETFVLAADGRILHKHVGAVTVEAWEADIRPLLEPAR